jgi:hypothetical protein
LNQNPITEFPEDVVKPSIPRELFVRPQFAPLPNDLINGAETNVVVIPRATVIHVLNTTKENDHIPRVESSSNIPTAHAPRRMTNIVEKVLRREKRGIIAPIKKAKTVIIVLDKFDQRAI